MGWGGNVCFLFFFEEKRERGGDGPFKKIERQRGKGGEMGKEKKGGGGEIYNKVPT